MAAAPGRVGQLVRQRVRPGVLVLHRVADPVQRVAGEPVGVLPAFPEDRLHVTDRRPADRHLYVVPRRPVAVGGRHLLGLRIALVGLVVAPAVAEIDPADVRDVEFRPVAMAQHHELLVVCAAGTQPHVQQALPAGRLDVVAEMPVLLLAELEPVQVRPPQQSLDDHTPPGRVGERGGHLGTRTVEPLVRVAAPVGEQQQIPVAQLAHRRHQLSEISRSVYHRAHLVAGAPGDAVGVAGIQPGVRVAPFLRGQEPATGGRDHQPTSAGSPDPAGTPGRRRPHPTGSSAGGRDDHGRDAADRARPCRGHQAGVRSSWSGRSAQ